MRGVIHHIDLTVRDPQASHGFYSSVLGFMGYRETASHDRGYDFDLSTPEGFCSIGVVRAEGPNAGRAHDRYSPGLHHIAWNAESREEVDRLYAHLRSIGVIILDPPADYPQYGEGYYAVFFADPDGLKLEYVFKPR